MPHREDETPDPGVVDLLVDAANVVGSRPDGWWRDRAGAAARLLAALDGWRSHGVLPDGRRVVRVVVVLEGRATGGTPPGDVDGSFSVVHAPGSGDDTLAGLCRPGVVLATSDAGLRARAGAAGAEVVGGGTLRRLLDEHAEMSPGPE